MTGYASIVKDEHDTDLKNAMLDHLIALMEDAHDFSWTGSKAAHTVAITKMEDCKDSPRGRLLVLVSKVTNI